MFENVVCFLNTVHGKILEWEKLTNLMNRVPFANFYPQNTYYLL